jgi:hypothetical protein
MAIKHIRQYKMALPQDDLGQLYDPMRDFLNDGNNTTLRGGDGGYYGGGAGGGFGGDVGMPTPVPTPPGNDIKLVLTNISNYQNEMTFDIQNNVYQEGAAVNIDSNKINDSLIIKPIVNDKFKTTNYFELQKALISKQIDVIDVVQQITPVININPFSSIFGGMSGNTGVSGLFGNSSFNFWKTPETKKTLTVTKKQTKQISGVRLVEFTNSEVIKSVTDYEFPLTKTLNFDIERVKTPMAVTNTITQAIQFISNYKNDTLNNEVNIKVTSGDILNGVVNTKLQNEVRFTNTNGTLGPVKIELSGFDKFLFKTIRWQYTDKFNENSDINLGDFNIVNDTIFNIDAATFNKNILILVEVAPDREDYPLLELVTNTIDQVILESIYASPTNSKLIDVDFSLKNTDFVKVTTPYRQYNVDINASSLALSKLQLDLKKDFLNNEGSFKVALVPSSTLYGDGDPQYVIIKLYWRT